VDPVSLIVGALAVGAGAGVKETATQAVKDAYAGLRRLVASQFRGHASAEVALVEHETDPATWRAPLEKALTSTGAISDAEILTAAGKLMELVDPAGAQAGKYVVDLRFAKNVQVGDHNRQVNVKGTYIEGTTSSD
jgi:hypothetical protein